MDSIRVLASVVVLQLHCGNQKQEQQTAQLVELPPFFKLMEILSCMMALYPPMVPPLLFGTLTHVQHVVLEAKELDCTSPVPTLCVHARLSCASLLNYLVEVEE